MVTPPQRLKSNTILSKTINVNKQNLTVTMVTARQKKAKSHQQKPTNDLNLENLKKLDSQTIRAQVGAQNYEASSMMLNPSETQSLLEDKGAAGQDHGVPQVGDKSTFKKTSDNQKKGGIRSKSVNNQKETDEEPQKTQEVIVEEPHLENHLEAPTEERKGSEEGEDKKVSLETIERDLIEKTEALDAQFFEVK